MECGCTVLMPTRDRAPIVTERGLYCDGDCLANTEIDRVMRMRKALGQPTLCPVCDEGHTSPAYGWTCSEACADVRDASLTTGAA